MLTNNTILLAFTNLMSKDLLTFMAMDAITNDQNTDADSTFDDDAELKHIDFFTNSLM